MDERILDYNFLIKRKTKKKKVKTLLINLDPESKSQQLGSKNFGTVRIKYEVKNLWELGYEEIKQKGLLGLLPFTPYLKGGGRPEIQEASEILQEQIESSTDRAEMIFLLAILAGRKYNTAGFKLLSPSVATMNIEAIRDNPTTKDLIHRLYLNEIADAKKDGIKEGVKDGIKEGVKKATEDLTRRLEGLLSKEQMKQVFG